MVYPDPATTGPETRARWHIEAAVTLQRESESTEPSWAASCLLDAAANHAAIASALIALEALADQQNATLSASQR